jgi:crotonobetainyl-CoA:carnitine CoA-transferase CaiB-like acyl-CoA transferase
MASPEGRELFSRLVQVSDVVICNFSAHVMERWGFDYAGLSAINPGIVYVSMPGFGHSGPHQDYRSNGPTIQALSGQTFACGLPDRESAGWGYSYMDHTAGYYGAAAVLQALYYRGKTGEGQFIDLAQLECACSLLGTYILDYTVNGRGLRRAGMPAGNRPTHPAGAPHGVYRCKGEDRWCAITVFDDDEWARFRQAIGDPAWAAEERLATLRGRLEHQDDLDSLVEAWTRERSQGEVMQTLQEVGIAAGMVQDPRQRAEEDPQLKARDHIVWVPTPDVDDMEQVRVDSLPMTIPALPHERYRIAPSVGQDNEYIFGSILGMSREEIDDCLARGIL